MRSEVELMRIVRVPPLGKLVVAIGNQRYEQIGDISDASARQRALAAIGDLITFAGGYQVLVDAGLAAPLAQPQVQEEIPISQEKRQEAFLASLQQDLVTTEQAVAPPSSTFSFLTQRPRRSRPVAITEPLSLVEQINEIFQRQLATDSTLSQHKIELQQALSGGLQIVVDGQVYTRPDDIPNKEIQLALKMALKEWETA